MTDLQSNDSPGSARADGYLFAVYSHTDGNLVESRIERLAREGVSVQYDRGILLGKTWLAQLADTIEHARGVLFFVSDQSAISPSCKQELEHARISGVPVFPVCIAGEPALLRAFPAVGYAQLHGWPLQRWLEPRTLVHPGGLRWLEQSVLEQPAIVHRLNQSLTGS